MVNSSIGHAALSLQLSKGQLFRFSNTFETSNHTLHQKFGLIGLSHAKEIVLAGVVRVLTIVSEKRNLSRGQRRGDSSIPNIREHEVVLP
jgi:hypothetical protein